jgi:glycosyltransferase involved in cell wall biosynthesis
MDKTDSCVDHILVVMGPVFQDARTLNMARTLGKQGGEVLVIGTGEQNQEITWQKDITIKTIRIQDFSRMFQLWARFWREVKLVLKEVSAVNYWAMDLYSLPILYHNKKHDSKLLFDSREIYSALGMNVGKPIKQQLLTEIERFYIKRADVVFTSGPIDSEIIASKYDLGQLPVVRNLPPYRTVSKTNHLREHFKIPLDKKIMLYQGMIHEGRGLEPFIEALSYMDSWVLCVLGEGRLWNSLLGFAKELGVSSKIYQRSPVAYEELPEWTSSADAGLCYIEPLTLSLKMALPNKLFEYAQAGLPIVASNLPQIEPIYKEYPFGVLLDWPATQKEWIQALKQIEKLIHTKELQLTIKDLAHFFCWENQEANISNLYTI